MKTIIKLFTVKYKWEYIQVDWIEDIYTRVCLSTIWKRWDMEKLCPELFDMNQWQAKDLCWVYWDFDVQIIGKEIEL